MRKASLSLSLAAFLFAFHHACAKTMTMSLQGNLDSFSATFIEGYLLGVIKNLGSSISEGVTVARPTWQVWALRYFAWLAGTETEAVTFTALRCQAPAATRHAPRHIFQRHAL